MTTVFVPPNFEELSVAQATDPQVLTGVVGQSPFARALSFYVSGGGFETTVLGSETAQLERITARGGLNGKYTLQESAPSIEALLQRCQTVFVVEPPECYQEIAWAMAPWLRPHHMIVLYDGGFGASLEFSRLIRASGAHGVSVVEMDSTFSFAATGDQFLRVGAVKQLILYSSINQTQTFNARGRMQRLFPKSEPARNVFHRGLSDLVSIIHPIALMTNINAICRGQSLPLYGGAFSNGSILIVERAEEEIKQIAEQFDISMMPFSILLRRSYGCDATTLYTALQSARCFDEDRTFDRQRAFSQVASTFVPLYELARLANLRTPVIESVINISSVLAGRDLLQTGRTLGRLGFEGMGLREIANNIHG